jgi:hypothetical protein
MSSHGTLKIFYSSSDRYWFIASSIMNAQLDAIVSSNPAAAVRGLLCADANGLCVAGLVMIILIFLV